VAAREPIRATRAIRAIDPEARVIALTEGDDYRALSLCLAAGAKGCLRKDSATIRLVPLMVALQRAPSVGSRATAADAPGGSASRAEETTFNRRRAKIVLSYLLRARVCAPVLALAVGATLAGCGGGGS
jgi:DNA-binding NarL/FixJ family response regulator